VGKRRLDGHSKRCRTDRPCAHAIAVWKSAYEGIRLTPSEIVSAALERASRPSTFPFFRDDYSIGRGLMKTNARRRIGAYSRNRRGGNYSKKKRQKIARMGVARVYTRRTLMNTIMDRHRHTADPETGRGIKRPLIQINTFFVILLEVKQRMAFRQRRNERKEY